MKRSLKPFILTAISILICHSSASAQLHVDSNGDVGMGVSTPGYKLEVAGGLGADGDIYANGAKLKFPGNENGFIIHNGNGSLYVKTGSSSANRIRIRDTADVDFYTDVDVDGDVDVGGKMTVVSNVTVGGYVCASSTSCPSDRAAKTDVKQLGDATSKLMRLNGKEFRYRKETKRVRTGLIAQEVEEVFPGAVFTLSNGMKGVAYTDLVAPMVEVIKEQHRRIQTLEQRLERIEQSPLAAALLPNAPVELSAMNRKENTMK